MTIEQIQREFLSLLAIGVEGSNRRREIGMSATQAATYRSCILKGHRISLEKKITWLRKANLYSFDEEKFTHRDLVGLLHFYSRISGEGAKSLGIEYVIEKWHYAKKTVS